MDELDMMRCQMAEMKRNLDNYRIVNEKLLFKVMKMKSSWLNRLVWTEAVTSPLMALLFWGVCTLRHLSPGIWISITVMLAISLALDFKTMMISMKGICEDNLLEFRRKLIRQKKLRKKQFIIELPLTLAWAVWFFVEFFEMDFSKLGQGDEITWILMIFIAFMVLTTVTVILWLYVKSQNTNDTLITYIDTEEAE